MYIRYRPSARWGVRRRSSSSFFFHHDIFFFSSLSSQSHLSLFPYSSSSYIIDSLPTSSWSSSHIFLLNLLGLSTEFRGLFSFSLLYTVSPTPRNVHPVVCDPYPHRPPCIISTRGDRPFSSFFFSTIYFLLTFHRQSSIWHMYMCVSCCCCTLLYCLVV